MTELSYIKPTFALSLHPRYGQSVSVLGILFCLLLFFLKICICFLLFTVKLSRGRISRNHFQRSRRQLEFSNLDHRTPPPFAVFCLILYKGIRSLLIPVIASDLQGSRMEIRDNPGEINLVKRSSTKISESKTSLRRENAKGFECVR